MPHCVAFECSIQAKNRIKDPKIRFHKFPDDTAIRRAWINAVGRTSLLTGRIFRFKLIRLNGHRFKITIRSLLTKRWPEHMRTTWTSNHLTSSPQRALRADQNGDRGKFELVLKASLRGQKEKSKAREHFSVRKIYFWRLKEHFNLVIDIFLKSGGSL